MTELEKDTKAVVKMIRERKSGWSATLGWDSPQFTKHARVIDAKKGLIQVQVSDIWPLI
jgi:hypothetical protein